MFRSLIILCTLSFLLSNASAEDRLAEYYRRAVPSAEQFTQRITAPDFTGNFAIYTLFDNMGILTSAQADLPIQKRPNTEIVMRLLKIAETMQDRNPLSPTFGNFRWYWNNTYVTDPNAAEFAAARMLSIYLDTPDSLSEENRKVLFRLLEHTITPCLSRRISPDYTNIALYNAVHLILLGQILDRAEVIQEGTHRLHRIAFDIWEHGIFEYNSPAYYFVDVDALQLGFRHAQESSTKHTSSVLLKLFWTDLALHWYRPAGRLAGAQSRTNNYLYGTSVQMTRHFAFAGLAPYVTTSRYQAVLNSFRACYQPPPEIQRLNDQYPRLITRNWGKLQGQWAALFMCRDIALGTAGAKYDSRQNMVQTVDIADEDQLLQRSYFIADGREDPYGIKFFPTGRAGQQKALHLDALWFGAQRTTDSLGVVMYPPEILAEPAVKNVQSHFVVRKPEAIWIDNKPQSLLAGQTIIIDNEPVVFRYKTCAFGIRVVWTRHQNGKPAKVLLIDDGNEHGVYRLTVEHGNKAAAVSSPNSNYAGAAFWIRIGSQIETNEQFAAWQQQFVSATVHRLDANQNNFDIAVAGQDGIVSVTCLENSIRTNPPAPLGILTLEGNDLGRPILETIPQIATFIRERDAREPILVESPNVFWEAESGYAFFDKELDTVSTVSSNVAVLINEDISWKLRIKESGDYFLWGRVQTSDAQHDSFQVQTAKQLSDGTFMRLSVNTDWHLGVRRDWTWVRLPIQLEKGVCQLTIKPREYEGKIDCLFLTTNAEAKPPAGDRR